MADLIAIVAGVITSLVGVVYLYVKRDRFSPVPYIGGLVIGIGLGAIIQAIAG